MRMGRLEPDASPKKDSVWVHASSLGECRAAYPLIEALKTEHPGIPLVFSASTAAGVAEARRLQLAPEIIFAPIDLPFILSRVFDRVRPQTLVLLESEMWPNWLNMARERDVRVVIVNGRLSQKSADRYASVRWASRILTRKIDFICAREKADAERFAAIGMDPSRITVTGNLKFDLMPWEAGRPDPGLPPLGGPGHILWTAGSLREGEEETILTVFATLKNEHPELKLILAPRHFERLAQISAMLKKLDLATLFRSAWLKAPEASGAWDVYLWDTFGDLWQAYKESTIVFVGGSLVPKGGQNPIEPAWFSKPVLFGPHMENFAEPARMLVEGSGAIQVGSAEGLERALSALLRDPAAMERTGAQARRIIDSFKGQATRKTLAVLEDHIYE